MTSPRPMSRCCCCPRPRPAALQAAALDTPLALQLLGGSYSANAHAFSTRYQNCNQWVAELLAEAWGPARPTRDRPRPGCRHRATSRTALMSAG
jgi:hypothetical protein